MREKLPTPEGGPIKRKQVIKSLRENPRDFSLLNQYQEQQEAGDKYSAHTLRVNLDIAEIYKEVGLIQAAREAYEDCLDMAYQEYWSDLYEQILKKLERLKI